MLDAQGNPLKVGDKVVVTRPLWGSLITMAHGVIQDVGDKSVEVALLDKLESVKKQTATFKSTPKSEVSQTYRVLKINCSELKSY